MASGVRIKPLGVVYDVRGAGLAASTSQECTKNVSAGLSPSLIRLALRVGTRRSPSEVSRVQNLSPTPHVKSLPACQNHPAFLAFPRLGSISISRHCLASCSVQGLCYPESSLPNPIHSFIYLAQHYPPDPQTPSLADAQLQSHHWAFAMPSGTSNDKPQQPKSSGFHSTNNLLPNKNIWNTGYQPGHARAPSLSSKGMSAASALHRASQLTIQEPAENGANVIHTNNDASVWPGYPWNDESSQSTSTSPNRTRDGGLSRATTFGNAVDSHPTIGFKNGLNGVKNGFQDGSMPLQKRPSHDTSYLDSIAPFSSARDPSAPPSRQSQPSPGFTDLYNGRSHGHAHSNSFQSQRPMGNPSVPLSHQATNSRAFNVNKQIDDELSMPFGRRVTVDHGTSSTGLMEQSSQPFQFNPGSQPFAEANGSRFTNGHDAQIDSLTNKFSGLKRPSIDRVSPGPSYRLEAGNSPRNYTQTPSDLWTSRSSSRDPRTTDVERRGSTQSFGPSYTPPYFPQQYPYTNVAPQFSPSYLEQFNQGFRHPMLPNYPLPFPNGYPLGGNMPPIRPAADHDPTRSLRSAMLEDYKNNKNKRWELKDFYHYMVEFSGDQHGSRFIQMKLETANSDEKDQVFREIEPNAIQLMKDVFGNYVVQKFFEHGNQVQKKMLADKIKSKMVDLSLQVYACRVVQKVRTRCILTRI